MTSINKISVIVPGVLNADIVGLGVPKIVGAGQYSSGGELKIGPGGKSSNIAQMIAGLIGNNKVAVISRTAKDPYGLWKFPIDALRQAGVNTKHIIIEDFKGEYPGIALIPVDEDGNNQIYFLPGVTKRFSAQDIKAAEGLFRAVLDDGLLAQTLEMSPVTAQAAIKMADRHNVQVVLDPGGMTDIKASKKLLEFKIYLAKPNEHEAQLLTGVKVTDFKSAQRAAAKLMKHNVENVLITHGKRGAYLFTPHQNQHIKAPRLSIRSKVHDETGCGDQTMAVLCAQLIDGESLVEAAKLAVAAGTLQFYKAGIQPLAKAELAKLKI